MAEEKKAKTPKRFQRDDLGVKFEVDWEDELFGASKYQLGRKPEEEVVVRMARGRGLFLATIDKVCPKSYRVQVIQAMPQFKELEGQIHWVGFHRVFKVTDKRLAKIAEG